MFTNIEELKNEIIEGKTNEQIIQERIEYLNSEEYKKSRLPMIIRKKSTQKMFYDGFLDSEQVTAWGSGHVGDVEYQMDEQDIFNQLIDWVRNHMDTKGISTDYLIRTVRNYFENKENAMYPELMAYIKKMKPNDQHYARHALPTMILLYENSKDYKGTLEDFAHGYMVWDIIQKRRDKLDDPHDIECYDKFMECAGWDKIDEEGIILPISAIKGANIAECTEYSLLTQNCLAFLGVESYLLGGTLSVGENSEEHNFNVVKSSSRGTYTIVDTAQFVVLPNIPNITSVDDLRNMYGVKAKRYSKDHTEVSYSAADEIRTKSLLQQKEEELSSLETEARKISEAEALIEQQKEGNDMGDE